MRRDEHGKKERARIRNDCKEECMKNGINFIQRYIYSTYKVSLVIDKMPFENALYIDFR
jgi:hypothetical protein